MKRVGNGIAALGMMTIVNAMSAMAQNMSYGANNFYRSDNVTVQPITFPSQYRMTVAGDLFISNDLDRNVDTPAVVVDHPMGAVKEQSANLYATKLAEQGFVTVSLDLPFWGGSEGEPRNAVSSDLYAEAFSAAVDYLGTQDFADRDVEHTEADGDEIQYTSGTPYEITVDTPPVAREFYDFYRTSRGEFTPKVSSPGRTTHPTLSSNVEFMNFYPFNDIEAVSPRPMLFIAGKQAHSREFSEDAYARAAEPKELFGMAGAGHVDLYDRVDLIPFDKLTLFFQTNLGEN